MPAACLRHASNTPNLRSLPRESDKKCTGTTRARSSESVAPSRISTQGHGFENLVVATLMEEFRKGREKDSGEGFWGVKTVDLDHV